MHNISRKQNIIRFISKEVTIFRIKPIRRELIEELLLFEMQAHRILSILFWAVDLTKHGTEPHIRSTFTYLLLPIQGELDSTKMFVSAQCYEMLQIVDSIRRPTSWWGRSGSRSVSDIFNKYNNNRHSCFPLEDGQNGCSREENALLEKHEALTRKLQSAYWLTQGNEGSPELAGLIEVMIGKLI
jgi:hypothetical protein